MSICTINGHARPVDPALKTWGQLLASLEHGEGAGRTIVSAVRFQGVDQPSFRAPASAVRPLAGLGTVDVELGSAADLIADAAASVIAGLEPLSLAAQSAADAFRRHDLGPAHQTLADFIGTFRALTRLTAAIEDLAPSPLLGADAHGFLRRLQDSLEGLVASAVDADWITVADVLEYEIAELLPEWGALLRDINRGESAIRRVS